MKYIEQENITNSYKKAYLENGVSLKALQWGNDYNNIALIYKELIVGIDINNSSILDVGCGFGDIIPYIYSYNKFFKYNGVDIVPEFIETAKLRYPNEKFIYLDYFNKPLKQKFDYIICCGALNGKSRLLEHKKEIIKLMFNNCYKGIAFNMTGYYPVIKESSKRVRYENSLDILTFCLSLSSKISFKQNYLINNFTIQLFK